MGKIRQLFRWSMQQTDAEAFAQSTILCEWYQMDCNDSHVDYYWSLSSCRSKINDKPETNTEERSELEKSIIAKLSDEVKVGISTGKAEVVIEKHS